jgi:tripartite-type tricarboxylate transporter receptor subunit TctC
MGERRSANPNRSRQRHRYHEILERVEEGRPAMLFLSVLQRAAHVSLCGLALAASTAAWAQDAFPTRPIRIIIPFAPGGSIDISARWVAERLGPALGQPVIVENRAGGDGLIAMRALKDAPADGHTLMAVSSLFSQAVALKKEPGYEIKEFVAIGGLSEAPLVVSGPISNPETTLAQVLARAKAQPETVSFGSGGVGTAAWLSATMMAQMAGVKLLHIPYKGLGAARPDMLGGRLTILFDTPAFPLQMLQEGRVRAYGVTSTARLPTFPNVPTIAEQGLPNYSYTVYNGLLALAGTPKPIVAKLDEAIRKLVASPGFQEQCRIDGLVPMPITSEQFAQRIAQDTQKVLELGIPKQ